MKAWLPVHHFPSTAAFLWWFITLAPYAPAGSQALLFLEQISRLAQ